MKVLLVNTSDSQGGAARACLRLREALYQSGIEVNLLSKEKQLDSDISHSVFSNGISEKIGLAKFAMEKAYFLLHEKDKKYRFQFSVPFWGENITKNKLVADADLIHLHWVNKSFLSLQNIQQLYDLGKPIVWTLHDMWTFTGGCHYAGSCLNYQKECGNCEFLKSPKSNDLSNKIWNKKQHLFQNASINFVTCSQWLADIALGSSLLKNASVQAIPNPINTDIYKVLPKEQIRKELGLPQDKKLILFVAMNVEDERKGFKYLQQSLGYLSQEKSDLELLIFGKASEDLLDKLPLPYHYLGSLSEQQKIINAYNASDLFAIPSLEDNLPNTVMESLACGVPVVGFDTGGIPEMVEHQKNGYIVEQKNAKQLAEGIQWVLQEPNRYKELANNAREKVLNVYSNPKVAQRYIQLYKSLL